MSCDGGGAEEANQHDWGHLAGVPGFYLSPAARSHGAFATLSKTAVGKLSTGSFALAHPLIICFGVATINVVSNVSLSFRCGLRAGRNNTSSFPASRL